MGKKLIVNQSFMARRHLICYILFFSSPINIISNPKWTSFLHHMPHFFIDICRYSNFCQLLNIFVKHWYKFNLKHSCKLFISRYDISSRDSLHCRSGNWKLRRNLLNLKGFRSLSTVRGCVHRIWPYLWYYFLPHMCTTTANVTAILCIKAHKLLF